MKKWISNGAEMAFSDQLIKIHEILNKYLLTRRIINPELYKEVEKNKEFEFIRQRMLIFNLCDYSIFEIDSIINSASILMCIDIEMRINKLCYYNLDEDVFESIEKLDSLNKMIVILYLIDKNKFKGTKYYQYIKDFKDFRNSFAHGKVQKITYKENNSHDIKVKKLNANIISEEKYDVLYNMNFIYKLNEFLLMCNKYIELNVYFNEINKFNEDIVDQNEIDNNKYFITEIKKRCDIIGKDLELDEDIKKSLQLILDRFCIDIISII